jgi:hypothetical protein
VIVGFTGRIGAGKNEAAKRLAFYSQLPVIEVSYAEKLKQSVAALLGITREQIERWKNDPSVRVEVVAGASFFSEEFVSMRFRTFLQRYGTEAHRHTFDEDFWLDMALPLDRSYGDAIYTVTDCRFPNEWQRIKSLGGLVVRLHGANNQTGEHESEQDLPYDVLIDNSKRDDDFEALDAQLQSLAYLIGAALPPRRSP